MLLRLLLIAALYVPWATQAQVTCENGSVDTVANHEVASATTTTSQCPAYSLYNYSYSEVIIPAEVLADGGVAEIKGFQYWPTNTTSSNYYNNCEIYLANTSVENLSNGFIQDPDQFQLVYQGDLNYTAVGWKTVVFDESFVWDGSSNIVVAVRRNHGQWASSGSYKAFTAGSALARYIYQDSGPYVIGSISSSGGYSSTTVPLYRFFGCAGEPITCDHVQNLAVSDIQPYEVTLEWDDTINSGATYTIYQINDEDTVEVGSSISTISFTITDLDLNTYY